MRVYNAVLSTYEHIKYEMADDETEKVATSLTHSIFIVSIEQLISIDRS